MLIVTIDITKSYKHLHIYNNESLEPKNRHRSKQAK